MKALAHPIRLQILELLKDGEKSVCEMVDELKLNQSSISQHLAVLRKERLVTSYRSACKTPYKIKHLGELLRLLKTVRSLLKRELETTDSILSKSFKD